MDVFVGLIEMGLVEDYFVPLTSWGQPIYFNRFNIEVLGGPSLLLIYFNNALSFFSLQFERLLILKDTPYWGSIGRTNLNNLRFIVENHLFYLNRHYELLNNNGNW